MVVAKIEEIGSHNRAHRSHRGLPLPLAAAMLGAAAPCVDGARRSMQQTTRRSGDVVVRAGAGAGAAPAMRLYGGGYLPRPRVIPPSGPSEGHNAVGPEDDQP
ncbi:hypothetical protein PVAP13_7KG365701 [Panicum virgatum]|uniref:Uncharacterized protein n=1 Tax=Panicum virgatum TaxID=38727 RepID=A0A8T0QS14_PANVG|nr:hypothetical protein PVAP13_7KG365701 [Panicum virgatum]